MSRRYLRRGLLRPRLMDKSLLISDGDAPLGVATKYLANHMCWRIFVDHTCNFAPAVAQKQIPR